jgi:hypothetical protein
VKRFFGSKLLRLVRGGVVLSSGEHAIASAMLHELPEHLRAPVESQFQEYNLVQRESDGRALNFYRMSVLSAKPRQVSQSFESVSVEAPLLRVAVKIGTKPETIHATLTAVGGRAFCFAFNRPVPSNLDPDEVCITHVSHAWRSNFPVRRDA